MRTRSFRWNGRWSGCGFYYGPLSVLFRLHAEMRQAGLRRFKTGGWQLNRGPLIVRFERHR
jgi:hypothetical protein